MRVLERIVTYAGRSVFRAVSGACVPVALLVVTAHITTAQQREMSAPAPQAEPSAISKQDSAPRADVNYRIGVGDLLDIRVFNQPKFSREGVRVDSRGMISMLLIPGEIQAACLTENELAREITAYYKEYFKNPQIDVFVKEYQSQPVAVIGAVNQPGRFLLQRRVRLLELLSFAGGPKLEQAGRTIHIVHAAPSPLCEKLPSGQAEDTETNMVSYSLSNTIQGDDGSNPYVRPGDIITIPEAEQVYVVGNVVKPSTILLKEPTTLSRAIAMAGGVLKDTKSDRVRIIRQTSGSAAKTEIYVDLKAIEKRRAEDIALQANDIVDVPISGAKTFLRGLANTFSQTLSALPLRVIP